MHGWYGQHARLAAQLAEALDLTDDERARVSDWDGLLGIVRERTAASATPQPAAEVDSQQPGVG